MSSFTSLVSSKTAAKRPVEFDADIAMTILSRMAEGETLSDICDIDNSMPLKTTVKLWAEQDHDGFQKKFDKAIVLLADSLFEKAITTSMNTGDTNTIARDRLTVETLMKAVGKLNPEKYGDKATPSGVVAVTIKTSLGDGAEEGGNVSKMSGGYRMTVKDTEGKEFVI